jgi:pyridoxamine 5'-phosphate oxidase
MLPMIGKAFMNLHQNSSNKEILIEEEDQDPFEIFSNWYGSATKYEINDPNAMNLATVSANLQPSTRMILLKEYDETGFIFNTNIESKKSNEIKSNDLVALHFYWKSLRRQVRIEGKAITLSNKEADRCFKDRPQESQIAAWASKQSEFLPNRKILNKRVYHYENIFSKKPLKRPDFWSGYKVIPQYFEFWWDVTFRLHYRIAYKQDSNRWNKFMLYP